MKNPKPVLTVLIDDDKKIFVSAPLENRRLCLNLLIEALKIVANVKVEKKPLIQPASVIPFIGNIGGGNGK